jgi:putative tricarboxylic transport membrane protein
VRKDVITGALLLLLAGGYHWLTLFIPSSALSDEVGADGLPRLLASALAIIAVLIMAKGILTPKAAAAPSSDDAQAHASIPRALGFVAIGAGYMMLAPWVGFAMGIAALVMAVALYEGERLSPKLFAIAVAGGVGFWLVFVAGLGTEQPAAKLLAMLRGS